MTNEGTNTGAAAGSTGAETIMVAEMIKDKKLIQVGPLLVRRMLSSSAGYYAGQQHYWRGYICPWNTPKEEIGRVGRLIEVRSAQQLNDQCTTYRAEVDLFAQVQLAYYGVIEEAE